jgi:hypothetical protein
VTEAFRGSVDRRAGSVYDSTGPQADDACRVLDVHLPGEQEKMDSSGELVVQTLEIDLPDDQRR